MVVVEPIRNRDDVQLMIEWLTLHSAVKESDRQRNLMLFLSGVNLGFRIGDIVKLKVKHVKGWHVQIVDEKTDKPTKRKMPKKFKNAMRQYIKPEYFTTIHRQKSRFTRQSHDEVSRLLIFYFNINSLF